MLVFTTTRISTFLHLSCNSPMLCTLSKLLSLERMERSCGRFGNRIFLRLIQVSDDEDIMTTMMMIYVFVWLFLLVLLLPTDHPRPPLATYQGSAILSPVPKPVLKQLRALAHTEGATLYSLLLAAWSSLLFRYTDQEEIAIGISPFLSLWLPVVALFDSSFAVCFPAFLFLFCLILATRHSHGLSFDPRSRTLCWLLR